MNIPLYSTTCFIYKSLSASIVTHCSILRPKTGCNNIQMSGHGISIEQNV